VGVGTRSWQAPPYHSRARHGGAPEGGASSRPLGTGIHDHTACGDIERCEHLSPIRAGWSFQQAMSRDGDRVAHRSVRPCQYAPSCMRSYSSRLTQGSNVVASMCGRPAASTWVRHTTPRRASRPDWSRCRPPDSRSRTRPGRPWPPRCLRCRRRRRARTARRPRTGARRGAGPGSPPDLHARVQHTGKRRPTRVAPVSCRRVPNRATLGRARRAPPTAAA